MLLEELIELNFSLLSAITQCQSWGTTPHPGYFNYLGVGEGVASLANELALMTWVVIYRAITIGNVYDRFLIIF